jgi:prepilin-type N-terminal cleavage/methylation domain-containing protein
MRRRDRRGFTILEAVIALAIVGLAGVAALEALGGELRAAERAGAVSTAAALAQDRLAAIAMVPAPDLGRLPDSLARGAFTEPLTDYRWRASVRPVLGERDLYDATVAVTGRGSEYSVTTRLYRPRPLGAIR